MMKKQLLHAMCLTVSLLGVSGGVNSASAASSSPVFAVNDDATSEDNNSGLPKTFGESTDANQATISKSDDGKTLTIKGKGDLTQIGTAYKFVSSLPTELFKDDDSHTKVSGGDTYSSETTYQTRAAKYTEIENFASSHVTSKTHYYFSKTGAGKYYTCTQTGWGENPTYKYDAVTEGTEVSSLTVSVQDENGSWVNKSIYFTKGDGETYTRVASVSTITSSNDDVTSKEIKHLKDCNDVFVKNGDTYAQAYNDAVYDENTTYYLRSWEYTTISEADLIAKAYLRNESDFIKALWENNAYETVKFENDGDGELLIDNDIVKAILYYQVVTQYNTYFAVNTNIKTLDLGAATCKNFSQNTFKNTFNANGTLAITDLTLPLAVAKDDVVTVPSLVVEALRGANGTQNLAKVTVPSGYTKIGARAFLYLTNVNFTLPDAITEICDSAFMQTGMSAWVLPTSLETIGKRAFYSNQSLASVTFPKSLRTIGPSAFADCKSYNNITLNSGLEIISNCAFFRNSSTDEQKVFNVPASVKYIGPGAFFGHRFMDVYYYGETAPLSPYGKLIEQTTAGDQVSAYDGAVFMGNSGFTPASYSGSSTCGNTDQGYANRENYINGGNYIAVLHFRSDISDDNAETFTDITRKYERWLTEKTTSKTDANGNSTEEGTGEYYWYKSAQKTVGGETEEFTFGQTRPGEKQVVNPGYEDTSLGSQLIWPSQIQWLRSYCANSNGYKWNGTDKYLPTLDNDKINLIRAQEGWVSTGDGAVSDDEIRKLAYMSTRQFVLVSRDLTSADDPEHETVDITGERWWTLVVPCDVTKKEVDRVFGANTRLCLFSKVVRQVSETEGNEVHLYFQNDTYKNKYTRAADGTWTKGDEVGDKEDEVVLYAHTPYMIYPAKRKDDGSKYVLENFELKEGDALVTVVTSQAPESSTSTADNVKYSFNGNYRSQLTVTDSEGKVSQTSVKAPQYSYVFGRKKTDDAYGTQSKFWFTSVANVAWGANKCLVERAVAQDNEDEYNNFFKQIAKDENNAAKQYSIFGDEEDNTTAIEKVIYHYGEDADAPIYNISGQLVSTNGSAAGLAKGIYIQNGKKFVVK